MAVNISKTKYIIFHNKGKAVEMTGLQIFYDDNEPNMSDPLLKTPLEHYHNNHTSPDCRAYRLLGIHLDEYLNLIFILISYAINLQGLFSA